MEHLFFRVRPLLDEIQGFGREDINAGGGGFAEFRRGVGFLGGSALGHKVRKPGAKGGECLDDLPADLGARQPIGAP